MDITAVKAKNFSVFSDITIPIAQNMNVFIGENGTGKTHLLKSIYAGCKMSKSNTIASFIQRRYAVFSCAQSYVGKYDVFSLSKGTGEASGI